MRSSTVHLFVFEGMADWEAAFAIAAIQDARFQLYPYRVRTAARSLAPVRTMGGMRIVPDMTIDELAPFDSSMLILPGGEAWEAGGNLEALERAHAFADADVPVAAICEATLALARTGLLDDRLHTSNSVKYIASSGYEGGRDYRNVPAIIGRNVITASGLAPIEFAYEILKRLYVYSPPTLDAWYSLYKYGDTSRFCEFVAQSA